MKLRFLGGSGFITNDTGEWQIQTPPDLGFSYDGIFFDDFNEIYVKYMGDGTIELTDDEKTAISTYVEAQVKPVIPPQPLPVPMQITMRQTRLALFQKGLLSQVQPLIDAMPEPQHTTVQIQWEYSATVMRDDDLVIQLGAALGLSSSQLDDLFILAATL